VKNSGVVAKVRWLSWVVLQVRAVERCRGHFDA
jgi:hypothetical protein